MKIFLLFILISSSIFTSSAYIYDDRLKNLQSQLNDVKTKVDDLLKNCKNASNSTSSQFEEIESAFQYNNTTVDPLQNNTIASNSTFLSKLKEKIQKFFHIKKDSKNKEAVKIKRCLSRTVGRNCEKINTKLSSDDELKQLLLRFFKCLGLQSGLVSNETKINNNLEFSTELPTLFDTDIIQNTNSQKSDEDEEIDSKSEAFLRYLASSKHSVEEIGRPKYNKPDLKKTQEIIDNAKSSMWMSFDDEEVTKMTTTTTEEYDNIPELPILKRETAENVKKDKRNGLFRGIINSVNDFQYEIPDYNLKSEPANAVDEQLDEINKLVEKIDHNQQEDLLKFLDQLNEKPKEFRFNVDKYFEMAFENITKLKTEETEESDNNGNIGPKKYFEFDSGSKEKRNVKDKRIENLKERLINQFRDHRHQKNVDFEKVVEHIYDNHVDNSFLDKTYRLNDGSIKTNELIKPLNIINHIKSPKEVKLDMELSEKIKEIEEDDFHSIENKRMDLEVGDVPFYKTEGVFVENDILEIHP